MHPARPGPASHLLDSLARSDPAAGPSVPPFFPNARSIISPPAGALFHSGAVVGGRYVVRQELNRGGTAVVYEALDTHDDSCVALKVSEPGVQVCVATAVQVDVPPACSDICIVN